MGDTRKADHDRNAEGTPAGKEFSGVTPRRLVQFMLVAGGIAVLFFVALSVRFNFRAKEAFLEGEEAYGKGDAETAMSRYDEAFRNYSLFNTWVDRSGERMVEIAEGYKDAGNLDKADEAYSTFVSAVAAIDTGFLAYRKAQSAAREARVEIAGSYEEAGEPWKAYVIYKSLLDFPAVYDRCMEGIKRVAEACEKAELWRRALRAYRVLATDPRYHDLAQPKIEKLRNIYPLPVRTSP